MDNELENEKFQSLYLEQVLANPEDLDALIHERENVATVADNLIARVGDNKIEQQALLHDMFRLVSREGAGEIVDTADAVLTLFQQRTMRKIFNEHRALMVQLYLASVNKLTKDSSMYASVDKLLKVGRAIAPFFKKKSAWAVANEWDNIRKQFVDEDSATIFSGLSEIVSALPPRLRARIKIINNDIQATDILPKKDLSDEEILQAIKEHPELNTEELALGVLGIMPWKVRRVVKQQNAEGATIKRKPGPVPNRKRVKDEEVLQAIEDHPEIKYNEIATDIMKIEPKDFYAAAARLRASGKIGAKNKRGTKNHEQPEL